jgi:hypothetical protein
MSGLKADGRPANTAASVFADGPPNVQLPRNQIGIFPAQAGQLVPSLAGGQRQDVGRFQPFALDDLEQAPGDLDGQTGRLAGGQERMDEAASRAALWSASYHHRSGIARSATANRAQATSGAQDPFPRAAAMKANWSI